MFNSLFGKKKDVAPSTVSATSVARPEDPQNTIVKLRDAITNQDKRYVLPKTKESVWNRTAAFDLVFFLLNDNTGSTKITVPSV